MKIWSNTLLILIWSITSTAVNGFIILPLQKVHQDCVHHHVDGDVTFPLHTLKQQNYKRRSAVKLNFSLTKESKEVTKYESEFRGMLETFAEYSEEDISSIDNYRLRALYEGVAASYSEPEVTRAFVVLFEELMPLRLAGRMIYNQLSDTMSKAQERRRLEEEAIAEATKLKTDQIFTGRKAFMRIVDVEDGKLSLDDLVNSGIVETVVELLGFDSYDSLISKMYENDKERLDFEMFLIRLQKCTDDSEEEGCDISTVLERITERMDANGVNHISMSDDKQAQRKLKFNQKYDKMVQAFQEWEDLVPSDNDGRMVEVLRGCFFGARNEKIVNALRIVYVDYAALRTAGDLIFSLMAKLVGRKVKL